MQKCETVVKKTKKLIRVILQKKSNECISKLNGNTVPIITANLREACSHDAVNHSTVSRWFKPFQEVRRSTKDNARTSHPSTTIDNILIAIMSTLLDEDRQMMVWEIEGALGIPKTIHHILSEYFRTMGQWT